MEVVGAVVAVAVFVAWHVVKTYNENTKGEKLRAAVSESNRSIERQFERPPNEHDLL